MNQLLLLTIFNYLSIEVLSQYDLPSCDSHIYCQGELLDKVQKARIFDDSKTFVDMALKNGESETLENFDELLKNTDNDPSNDDLKQFVDDNFEDGDELDEWTPEDFKSDPSFLESIDDDEVKRFAQNLVKIWPQFGRKIKDKVRENPGQYSLIPVENPFIVPGGRFNEFYYWDTLWIIKGLLVCEMQETVKGMLENFFEIVSKFSFIPNGARVYYLNRSQPPLLTLMVANYIKATDDTDWLTENIKFLEKELSFWEKNRTIDVSLDGTTYTLYHYASESGSPRPESYYEDVETASSVENDSEKMKLYANLKSAAESGWDFSSRWMKDPSGTLKDANTRQIIPVDLNSFLCQAFSIMANFYKKIENNDASEYWSNNYKKLQEAITKVLYNEDDGIWYDYDMESSKQRKFFYPSNLTPLWSRVHGSGTDFKKIIKYLQDQKVLDYEGGIPASLKNSGQQWDFPDAWPPLQEIIINGLYKSGNEDAVEVAQELAQKWVKSNMASFDKDGVMYEKYDAEKAGETTGGGEYEVQKGFGWSNGVALMLINKFFVDNN